MTTGVKPTIGQSVKPVDNTGGNKTIALPQTESSAPESRPIAALSTNLEDLTFLGKVTKKFKISGFEFEMSTLTAGENEASLLNTGVTSPDDVRAMGSLPYYVLAYSIRGVNNVAFESLVAAQEGDNDYEKKVSYLKSLQQTVLQTLMGYYTKLQTESSSLVDGEQSKN